MNKLKGYQTLKQESVYYMLQNTKIGVSMHIAIFVFIIDILHYLSIQNRFILIVIITILAKFGTCIDYCSNLSTLTMDLIFMQFKHPTALKIIQNIYLGVVQTH